MLANGPSSPDYSLWILKRLLIHRLILGLLSVDFEEASDSLSQLCGHGWTINTEYYTADVSVWMAHLHDAFSIGTLPMFNQLAALVIFFDMNDVRLFPLLRLYIANSLMFYASLSVDGDSQGVERLYGALSAHMWPGMILKSGNKITEPSLPEKEELSSGESNFEFEYEILSAGSAEPWDDTDKGWVSTNAMTPSSEMAGFVAQNSSVVERDQENGTRSDEEKPSTSTASL
ncbi:hypothetical protein SO802_032287 [Lithocarpus litseifolius]|uniref:Uncharacterized protein n=1 Tax=Lithocarpus litseifolius TaxID=425828 RepID=A0AAW2BN07_9ROSI